MHRGRFIEREVRMISVQRVRTILNLAVPVTIGLSSTVLMAMVDLAMVGSLGTTAVAAVGLAGFSYALVSAILHGLTPAVQATVARHLGEGSSEPQCLPLNAGMLLALVCGLPLALLCYVLTPWYVEQLSSDPEVISQGVRYLQALSIGLVFDGLDNAFEGHWSGAGKTRVYMSVVLFANAVNVFLNYVLIYGNLGAPALGVEGAGYATSLSMCAGVVVYFLLTLRGYRAQGFLRVKPTFELTLRMCRIGLPATMQAMFFSLGYVVFLWIVSQVGTPEVAATNVLVRINLLMNLFAQALATAAITLVSRTLGEGDANEAARWGWDVGKISVFWITALCLPLVLVPELCLSLFLTDPETLALAILPARLTGAFLGVASLIYIFAAILITQGDGKRVLLVSFTTQWILFLPAVWLVGVTLQGGLLGITLVQLAYGLIATSLITAMWNDGRWKQLDD
jgi:MATE family multidrug resistance protein